MGDLMRPLALEDLVQRIVSEYQQSGNIFGIPSSRFFKKSGTSRVDLFGNVLDTPIGPAAGPHTQLAQNIITSYLAGGRFIELKTVQIMDTLEIDKPCIDARDEAYNVEWSTEYTLPKAYREYVHAWVVLHLLEELFNLRPEGSTKPTFLFNMSVGYDLKGIKTERMQYFIDNMLNATNHPYFQEALQTLEQVLDKKSIWGDLADKASSLKGISKRIAPQITPNITLSTMHGCPPDEIEAIAMYLLTEKGVDAWIKLNPTLLTYDGVRTILDSMGYNYITLKQESFDHDLQYPQAIEMLTRLRAVAAEKGRNFGVKLTNTLGVVNNQGQLPGEEMYMSGRALYPLAINLAAKLSKHFKGTLPISYSGGADIHNIKKIFDTGIRPITLATEMLKPGGYLRMADMAAALESSTQWKRTTIDVPALEALAKESLATQTTQKEYRGSKKVEVQGELPLTDCYVAPCTVACPIGQDVPAYIGLVGEGRYKDAVAQILDRNPLPHITAYICDHKCMYNCTRMDYDNSVQIRDMKKVAMTQGFAEYLADYTMPKSLGTGKAKVAVVGAGPAGLSTAYFLALTGAKVRIFEKQDSAGGVVKHVIPEFRYPQEVYKKDMDFIASHGVEFQFSVTNEEITADALTSAGYDKVVYCVGAEKGRKMAVSGDTSKILPSLQFLAAFNKDPKSLNIGKHVLVVGGGNTAMDSARGALRVPGVESVTVVYRRTLEEMPADREEYDFALEEGVKFHFLTLPEDIDTSGSVTCRVMELGAPDNSGRRRPVATDKTIQIKGDTVITAIGELQDATFLESCGLPVEGGWVAMKEHSLETKRDGVYLAGDAESGPSSIIAAAAGGRRVATAIAEQDSSLVGLSSYETSREAALSRVEENRGKVRLAEELSEKDAQTVARAAAFAQSEASRCLQCDYICNKCVDVCPNRANMTLPVPGMAKSQQVIHIDAYCNECGNCARFCPWEGKPYKDKFTVFSLAEDFQNSTNPGMLVQGDSITIREKDGTTSITTVAAVKDKEYGALVKEICTNHPYLLTETLE